MDVHCAKHLATRGLTWVIKGNPSCSALSWVPWGSSAKLVAGVNGEKLPYRKVTSQTMVLPHSHQAACWEGTWCLSDFGGQSKRKKARKKKSIWLWEDFDESEMCLLQRHWEQVENTLSLKRNWLKLRLLKYFGIAALHIATSYSLRSFTLTEMT